MGDVKLYQHPDYQENIEAYQKYEDLYIGDHEILTQDKYLWFHELEKAPKDGVALRQIREKRSRYTNLAEPIESTWISIVLMNDPNIPKEVSDMFGEEESKDVDGEGRDLIGFLRNRVAPMYFRFGKALVLADTYNIQAKQRLEQETLGLRPFLEVLNPLEVKDWELETSSPKYYGKYKAIRCEYYLDEPRNSLEEKPERTLYSKALYIQNGQYFVRIYRAKKDESGKQSWGLVEERPIPGWSYLPISAVHCDSWMKDVSEQILKLFNLESSLDSQLNAQAFQRIFVAGTLTEEAKVAFSEYVVRFLPENARVDVIEPSSPLSLEKRIEQTVSYLFKVAFNQVYALASDSRESPSSQTIAASKEEQYAIARNAISDLEVVINTAIKHYAKFKGQEDFKGQITLSRDINDSDITQQMELFQAHVDSIVKVPRWHKTYLKKVVDEQNLNDADLIKQDIDNTPFGPTTSNSLDVRTNLLSQINGRQTTTPEQNGLGNKAPGSGDRELR